MADRRRGIPPGRARGEGIGMRLGGLLLLLPMVILWLVALVVPTVRTVRLSTQNVRIGRESVGVGLANYRQLFGSAPFAQARDFTALLAIERVLVVALVPLLLALAVNAFGRWVRLPFRLIFTLPLAFFAPVGAAIGWSLAYNPTFGPFRGGGNPLGSAGGARLALLRMDALTTLALACGLGLIAYLLARRRGAVALIWALSVCATLALALQSFVPSFVLTRGGPANSTATLGLLTYTIGFQNLQLGAAAALSALLLALVGVLGVLGAILLAASGARLTLAPVRPPARSGRGLAAIVLLIVGLGAIVACAYGAFPALWSFAASFKTNQEILRQPGSFFPAAPAAVAYGRTAGAITDGRAFLNTLVPPLLGVFAIQLPVAYLGALGIGALRPLGRWSEWLLLPFAPWLFVTPLLLGIANFEQLRATGGLNRYGALIPPPTMTVALLFILTLGFKGQALARRAARDAGQQQGFLVSVIGPSLPLALLLALAAVVLEAQELFWPLLVASSNTLWTVPVALVQALSRGATDVPSLAALLWRYALPGGIVVMLLLVVAQIFYVERLALEIGHLQTRPEG
jgi:ABC-type sugar transport system permease subunit